MEFHECVLNNVTRDRKILATKYNYEGWNFNSGNYLFTTDTK